MEKMRSSKTKAYSIYSISGDHLDMHVRLILTPDETIFES
jgi:hypothetical protein